MRKFTTDNPIPIEPEAILMLAGYGLGAMFALWLLQLVVLFLLAKD